MDGMDGDRVVTDEPVLTGRFGRIRIAAEGPDGALYLLTSNRNLARHAPATTRSSAWRRHGRTVRG
jgi:glucose/arabinose dehydrogenase